MSNILIIKHGSLGDIAQACGAIQDISENHKEDQIHLLTTKPYFELFKKNPFIDNVILDKRLSKFNLIYLYQLTRLLKNLNFVQKILIIILLCNLFQKVKSHKVLIMNGKWLKIIKYECRFTPRSFNTSSIVL